MKIQIVGLWVALVLNACGAQVNDGHTGGKTSWLSTCNVDADCKELRDAVCASGVCTTPCENACAIDRTSCVTVRSNDTASSDTRRACLPQCERDADCRSFGESLSCEDNACVADNTSVADTSEDVASADALSDASEVTSNDDGTQGSADAGDSLSLLSTVRDIPGVVLLDDGEDGDNVPLEDTHSPKGFNSYGFWYTYDDLQVCMGDAYPNTDTFAVLEPAQGALFTTTAYSALALAPPPETLANAPDNMRGLAVKGSGHEYWGGGLGFKFMLAYDDDLARDLDVNGGVDLRAAGYTGVRFWVYATYDMNLVIKLQDAYSTPQAGLCEPRGDFPQCHGPENCLNAPSTKGGTNPNIQAGPSWRLYELYFADVEDDPATEAVEWGPLWRADWAGADIYGNPMNDIPPTPDHIYQLQFETAEAEEERSFTLVFDNIGFIEADGVEDNANGRFAPL